MSEQLQDLIGQYCASGDVTSRVFAEAEAHFHSGHVAMCPVRVWRWVVTVNEVYEFAAAVGRLPRERGRAQESGGLRSERSLASWLRYQRTPAARAAHCNYQVERLECLPGFSWDPRGDAQRRKESEYVAFFKEHGHAPRYRSADEVERGLADWAAKRRSAARRGALTVEEIQRLRAAGVPVPRTR